MRLSYLFAAFFLGSLLAEPSDSQTVPVIETSLLFLSAAGFVVLRKTPAGSIASAVTASFFLGFLWIACLPTWPKPLDIDQLPDDRGCTIVGTAAGDSVETRDGRFIPITVELVRAEGFSCGSGAISDPWTVSSGLVMVKIRRDFNGLPGGRYIASGILVVDPDCLHEPILARYRSRALIIPRPTGPVIELIESPSGFQAYINTLRYRLISHLSWGIGKSRSELVSGITFGRRSRRLEGSWAGDFYTSGLSHLIVASGAQVSLLFMPILFLMARVRIPHQARWTLIIAMAAALIGFAKLLGGEPSILRAAAMGCILLFAMGVGRHAHGLATLSAAGWFWLLQNPLLSRDFGFLLSMGASFGIIYFGPIFFESCNPPATLRMVRTGSIQKRCLEFVVHGSRSLLQFLISCSLITFSAQLGVLPVLASTVGRVSPVGIVANLFAVPLGQIVLFLGALSGVTGFVCPSVSMALNGVLEIIASALMAIANDFANLPGANLVVPPLPGWIAVAYYAVAVVLVEKWRVGCQPPIKKETQRTETTQSAGRIIDLDKPLPPDPI